MTPNKVYDQLNNTYRYNGPNPHYDRNYTTMSSEEADRLGYIQDDRGHRDDRVKSIQHPSHPYRGTFENNTYELSEFGMNDPNYSIFGLADNGDGNVNVTYKGISVLPEVTISPNNVFIYDSYNNIIYSPRKFGQNKKGQH